MRINESDTMTIQNRLDHQIICGLVRPQTRILDLGCGDGDLMSLLVREKNATVQGIELNGEAVQRCVEKGLTVFQGDIETGLTDFPDRAFDGAIVRSSDQAEYTPRNVRTSDERTKLVYAVKIKIANPDHALKPGLQAEAWLER